AELAGYQTSALASAIEDDMGAKELTKAVGMKTRPVATLRVGKAAKPARHSPRRSGAAATKK
ncbi:MAG TPA: hypothetical protein VHQ86_06100, partial [Candidatus Saccharimonadia bacterium]|nr:hypothetical protein [Candidatus Saccharimonadia bacterium]